MAKSILRDAFVHSIHTLYNMWECAQDIPTEGVIKRDGIGKLSHLTICKRSMTSSTLDENLLNNLDRRAKPKTSGLFCKTPQEGKKDFEVSRKERVKVYEDFLCQLNLVVPCVCKPCCRSE
jgi:hypothetical protein